MLMEYTAMIRRGWPNEGALHRAETIKASTTLSNGDWVVKHTDNSVMLAGSAPASNAVTGLVVSGNGDSASATNSNKAVVLWGNFIADVSNYDVTGGAYNGNVTPTYAAGADLTVVSGKLTPWVSNSAVITATTATSTALTVSAVASGFVQIGQTVTGAGVPTGTTIASGSGTAWVLSAATTASASGVPMTLSGPAYPVVAKCLDVVAAVTGTTTAHLTVLVK